MTIDETTRLIAQVATPIYVEAVGKLVYVDDETDAAQKDELIVEATEVATDLVRRARQAAYKLHRDNSE